MGIILKTKECEAWRVINEIKSKRRKPYDAEKFEEVKLWKEKGKYIDWNREDGKTKNKPIHCKILN
jgi:hypothetical protein